MSGGGAGGASADEVDRDEDLGAIVEAEEDAVDRSVHPSGIVPVLQYVSCARRVRVRGRGRWETEASGRRAHSVWNSSTGSAPG